MDMRHTLSGYTARDAANAKAKKLIPYVLSVGFVLLVIFISVYSRLINETVDALTRGNAKATYGVALATLLFFIIFVLPLCWRNKNKKTS